MGELVSGVSNVVAYVDGNLSIMYPGDFSSCVNFKFMKYVV